MPVPGGGGSCWVVGSAGWEVCSPAISAAERAVSSSPLSMERTALVRSPNPWPRTPLGWALLIWLRGTLC